MIFHVVLQRVDKKYVRSHHSHDGTHLSQKSFLIEYLDIVDERWMENRPDSIGGISRFLTPDTCDGFHVMFSGTA